MEIIELNILEEYHNIKNKYRFSIFKDGKIWKVTFNKFIITKFSVKKSSRECYFPVIEECFYDVKTLLHFCKNNIICKMTIKWEDEITSVHKMKSKKSLFELLSYNKMYNLRYNTCCLY